MDLRRLRALEAVVDTGSVTAAADQVGYTPSAVSQHVAALERETGTLLLERAGRGVRPTEAGRLLAEHARAVLSRVAEAEAAMAALQNGRLGALRVISFPTAGASLVPPALAAVRRELPQLEVALQVAERDSSLPALRQGEAEVVVTVEDFAAGEAPGDGLVWGHLLDDPYRVVLPRGHRLASRRVIELAELAEDNWVETMCGVGCCQDAATKVFSDAGFEPRRTVEADEYWPAQGFVAAGLGVALIPTLGLGVLHEAVVVRRLRKDHEPVRHVWAATRPALVGHIPVEAMLRALRAAAGAHSRAMGALPRGADAPRASRYSIRPPSGR
ncbi:MAG: LysR family transcriptional regulator [Acidimicrobiales bacterium]